MGKPRYQLLDALRPEEYAALRNDIKKRGVKVPVEVDTDGNVLDGHNRVRIAKQLDAPYKTITRRFKTEADKREHVIKLNLARRHLGPIEWGRAFALLLVERGVKRGRGKGDPHAKESKKATVALLAGELGVPERTAKHRLKQSDDYEKLPAKDKCRVKAGDATLQQVKREKHEAKRERRRRTNRSRAKRTSSLDATTDGVRFATIVIDPPWDVGDEGDVNQLGRAKADYATMPIEEIEALPVGDRADDDCHLYLWITNRSLPKGFRLLDAWGFRYVTCLTWCKPSFGMGNYFRGSTEQILFGVKGSQPLKRKNVGTWFPWPRPRKKHSSKPDEFFTLVESCSPGPYLEMFARRPRKGWIVWGADV